ncbi:metallophosphoesterase [Brevibacterium sp. CS2]|uniref:metallophosphoesterase family protein n=1 Tax=Brevibacterium sp. CS2 TaxID=2575923 RepID=UPI0010C772EF|nr:metallophosphoesterase [Brevibacterium sp. CS2]QCP03993.1 metallophosphoesterase [Brevibacterium sp. CS2]
MSPLLTRTPPGGRPGRRTHRFDEPRDIARTLFRVLPGLGVVLACLLLVAPWAVLTARTEANFGPHMAEYSLTTDAAVTIDLGALGSVRMPAAELLPFGLGARIDVGEIPAESALGGTTLDALGEDVSAYATFFSSPEGQFRIVARGLAADALAREAGAGLGLAALIGVVVVMRGPPDRSTPRSRRRTTAGLASGTALACLLAVLLVPIQRPQPITANPAFAGTPLAGAEVTGRLSGVIDEAVGLVDGFIEDNDAFYDQALAALDTAWTERPFDARWSAAAALVPPPDPRTGGHSGEVVTAVLGSDLHCNVGMARVVGDVVVRTGADLYLDGGDITMTGTPAENYCVDALAHQLPDRLPRVLIKGNHDSLDTARHAASTGWTVLADGTVEIAGLRIHGGPDPRRTVFGVSEPVLETGETAAEFGARMAAEACGAEADITLIHDPRHAQPALETGCVPFALSGHWHRRVGPEPFARGIRYVSSTTGGALADALTPGPLKMPAELSIIRFDADTGAPLDLQVVTVDMDAGVTFSARETVPRPGPWAPAEDPEAGAQADGGP